MHWAQQHWCYPRPPELCCITWAMRWAAVRCQHCSQLLTSLGLHWTCCTIQASTCSRTSFSLVAATRGWAGCGAQQHFYLYLCSPLWHPPSSPVSLILVALPVEGEPQLQAGPQHMDGFLLNQCSFFLEQWLPWPTRHG